MKGFDSILSFGYLICFWIFCSVISSCSGETVDKSMSEPREYDNLCEFNGAIVVQMTSKGEYTKYLECVQNGVARKERIHPTLYMYLDEFITPGTIIQCDSTNEKTPVIKNLIPPLETDIAP